MSNTDRIETELARAEQWTARLLESSMSFPMLAYFRSQHLNQSWLSALTSIPDAAALSASAVRAPPSSKRSSRLPWAATRWWILAALLASGRPAMPMTGSLQAGSKSFACFSTTHHSDWRMRVPPSVNFSAPGSYMNPTQRRSAVIS